MFKRGLPAHLWISDLFAFNFQCLWEWWEVWIFKLHSIPTFKATELMLQTDCTVQPFGVNDLQWPPQKEWTAMYIYLLSTSIQVMIPIYVWFPPNCVWFIVCDYKLWCLNCLCDDAKLWLIPSKCATCPDPKPDVCKRQDWSHDQHDAEQ